VRENRWVLVLYLVPSSLYCLYNNLSFYSLSYFNPTTYFMFMQIRLLITGLIYQARKHRSKDDFQSRL
jgi:UDP-sugar transporter A1/2/3